MTYAKKTLLSIASTLYIPLARSLHLGLIPFLLCAAPVILIRPEIDISNYVEIYCAKSDSRQLPFHTLLCCTSRPKILPLFVVFQPVYLANDE